MAETQKIDSYVRAAGQLLGDVWHHPDGPTLRFWHDNFWEWDGRRYRRLTTGTLKARLGQLCHERSWKDDTYTITNLRDSLLCNGGVHLPNACIQPSWLKGRQGSRYFTVRNGILDLEAIRSGQPDVLIPHTPNWFVGYIADYNYDPKAECPRWHAYLHDCLENDTERIRFLQEWFGYCLTPDNRFQCALFLQGPGNAGKSTSILVLKYVLGPDNCSLLSLENLRDRFRLSALEGKLANLCGDGKTFPPKIEAFFKQYTGGESMSVRDLYKPPRELTPTARMMVSFNTLPDIEDSSSGMWRRFRVLPWTHAIPKDKIDLRYTLEGSPEWPFYPELPGILNWAIQGYCRLYNNNRFTEPAASTPILSEWRLNSHPVWEFFDTRLELETDSYSRLSTRQLRRAYLDWCGNTGHSVFNDIVLGRQLHSWAEARGLPVTKAKRRGSGGCEYSGIRLRPAAYSKEAV